MEGIHENCGRGLSLRERLGRTALLALLGLTLAACAPMSDTSLTGGDGGDSGDGPPLEVTGNWLFGIQPGADGCDEERPFEYLLVYMLQDGGNVALHLDLDGNQAFTEGSTVYATVSGPRLRIAGNFELDGGASTVHWEGELVSPVWGQLSGTITETVVDNATEESCERELLIATLRTANPPIRDLTGAWTVTSTVEWGSGALAGSVGATDTVTWDIVQATDGIERGLFRVLETNSEGKQQAFLGVVNNSQISLARHGPLMGGEVTYLYTTLNFTEGWDAGDRLDGQLIAELADSSGEVETIGWGIQSTKSVPEGLAGPGVLVDVALPAIPLSTRLLLELPR